MQGPGGGVPPGALPGFPQHLWRPGGETLMPRRRIRGGTCQSCKTSKVKCDRIKPTCGRCRRLHLTCTPQKSQPSQRPQLGLMGADRQDFLPLAPPGSTAVGPLHMPHPSHHHGLDGLSSGGGYGSSSALLAAARGLEFEGMYGKEGIDPHAAAVLASGVAQEPPPPPSGLTSAGDHLSAGGGLSSSSWTQLQLAASRLLETGATSLIGGPDRALAGALVQAPAFEAGVPAENKPVMAAGSALGAAGRPSVSGSQEQQPQFMSGVMQQQQQQQPGGRGALNTLLTRFAALLVSGNVREERVQAVLLSWHLWNHQSGRDTTGGVLSSLSAIMGVRLPETPILPPTTTQDAASGTPLLDDGDGSGSPNSSCSAGHAGDQDMEHKCKQPRRSSGPSDIMTSSSPEEQDLRKFLVAGMMGDQAALCAVTWCRGNMEIEANERFTSVYMTRADIERNLRGGSGGSSSLSRPELLWEKLVSPEDRNVYLDCLFHVCFTIPSDGAEVVQRMVCVDRWGLELPCLVRLRIYASQDGWYSAAMIGILPVPFPTRALR